MQTVDETVADARVNRRRFLCLCCTGLAMATVPVRAMAAPDAVATADEPHHHVIFENADVRLIRVMLPAGDITGWHRHFHDYVMASLRGAETRTEQEGEGKAVISEVVTDSVRFAPFADKPVVHRVANQSSWLYHQIGFEILSAKPAGVVPDRAGAPQFQQILDNERVRAWRLKLIPGAFTPPTAQRGPGVRVILAGDRMIDRPEKGSPVETDIRAGDAAFLAPDTRAITNSGGGPLDLIEFELK